MPYSFSQIDNYTTCPAKLRFYRQKVKTPEAAIMQAGSLAHQCYDAYFQHCLEQNRQTDITHMPVLARKIYDSQRAEYAKKRKPYLSEAQFAQVVETLLVPFAASHLVDGETLAETEQRIAITDTMQQCDWMAGNVWFRGVLDTLYFTSEDTAEVHDYKTGFAMDPNPLQFDIYAWLVFALYPAVKAVKCVFDYTRFGILRDSEYSRDDFDAIDARVRELCAMIEADTEMPPCPGMHCLTCDYGHVCEAKAEMPGAIVTDDDARKAVEAISLYERDLKAAKDKLRPWCTEHGTVEVNGVAWGFHESGDRCFPDAKALHDALIKDGETNPWQYLSVAAVKAKKLIERYYELTESSKTLKFEGKKAKADKPAKKTLDVAPDGAPTGALPASPAPKKRAPAPAVPEFEFD